MNGESNGVERRKLGELLIAAGLVNEEQLRAALAEQQNWNEPIGRTLVQMGFLSEDLLVKALSRHLGVPACDPATMEIAPGTAGYLGLHLVERFGVMPVAVDTERRVMVVATADPTDKRTLAELGDHVGFTLQPMVAASSRIELAIRKHYYGELGEVEGPAPAPSQAPQQNGAFEQQRFEEQEPAPQAAAGAELDLAALQASLADMERLAGGQLRALRVLVQMLVDKGIIRHEEYLARIRGEEPPGGR